VWNEIETKRNEINRNETKPIETRWKRSNETKQNETKIEIKRNLDLKIYGGIFLPPICEINYVNMQENYVNMQDTNVLEKSDFSMGKITCVSPYLTS
jgi:hypothetical protein